MEIIIDKKSGFCFGVRRAIELAEEEVRKNRSVYCLGEIVHNSEEVKRLEDLGVKFIDRNTFFTLSECKVLFRAHGEPPDTYDYARKNNIEIIDATCPVVIKLQEKVRNAEKINPDARILIFGSPNHPEVIGLQGQIRNPVVVETPEELSDLDYSKPIFLFAQTTKNKEKYAELIEEIRKRMKDPDTDLVVYDSICGQVANRAPWLAEFSKTVDILIFVGGKTSSNSKMLFSVCKQNNPNSFFITHPDELDDIKLPAAKVAGIAGATSTPQWLINKVAAKLGK